MGFRTFRRASALAVSLSTITASTAVAAIVVLSAGTASAASSSCPNANSIGNRLTADNVGVIVSASGNTLTYTLDSFKNESPVGGVPGLIKLCVYPSTQPSNGTASYDSWAFINGSSSFTFERPGGDPTNIPLDGSNHQVGTATWSNTPPSEQIILHINDPAECASLYGSSSSGTCFVKPHPGPVCNAGDTAVAYNAMPFKVVDCYTAAQAFEAQSQNEFGDEVTLASGSGTTLVSLKVMFASYGCSVSGHWNTGDCVTTPGATFTVPITAHIYDPGNLSTPLATVTVNQTIPYRPSADNVNCTGTNAGKWFNIAAGRCQYSIGTVLTFNFPTVITHPATVVWTVAFDTTHYGPSPIGESATCFSSAPGCPYDSLNVGTTSFPGAPYAGTDVSEDQAVQSTGQPYSSHPIQLVPGFTGFRPLGEIITSRALSTRP